MLKIRRTITIDDDIYQAAKILSKNEGRSVSNWINFAMIEKLRNTRGDISQEIETKLIARFIIEQDKEDRKETAVDE